MSWNFSGIGRAAALSAKMAKELSPRTADDPDDPDITIKPAMVAAVQSALAACGNSVVRVNMISGRPDQLLIQIDPVTDFVE